MEQLTIEHAITARELRDEGMKRAVDHAERETPGWQDQAIGHVRVFAGLEHEFMCEEARRFAESRGIAPPPDKRAWGAVMMKCAKLGLIEKVGLGYAKDPKVHMNPASIWRSKARAVTDLFLRQEPMPAWAGRPPRVTAANDAPAVRKFLQAVGPFLLPAVSCSPPYRRGGPCSQGHERPPAYPIRAATSPGAGR
jgi:hypothetical protein